ncbi:MAG: ATP/GTP-binding protein [bacterium]
MLIEFAVTNFRSIRETQRLTMAASNKDKQLPDHVFTPPAPRLSNTKLLKSAVIYGANASGKSNLFKAAQFMRWFVVVSAAHLKPGEGTGVTQFRLDPEWVNRPAEFEIEFIQDSVRYRYYFAIDQNRVYEEGLIAHPQGPPQRWYTRSFNHDSGQYEWNFSQKFFKGEKKSLQEKTRDNALFLSTAAQFNHAQLKRVYQFFKDRFRFIDYSNRPINPMTTVRIIRTDEKIKQNITNLLRNADFGISDFSLRIIQPDELKLPEDYPQKAKEEIIQKAREGNFIDIDLLHTGSNPESPITIDFEEEATGTQKFFSLLGPLLEAVRYGSVLWIDELGSQMHSLLIRKIVELIHSPEANLQTTQLVFTTHDTTLLDTNFFRRDQIWFMEKNPEGATILYPLTDYKPRQDEALQKGYLAGRYGAIPFLEGFSFE